MFFQVWEKWYVQSEATEVCEFRAKIPAFYCSFQRRLAHIQREKFYSKSFLAKKVKNISEIRGGSRGRVQGVRTLPWDDLRFSNTIGILKKKKKLCGLLVLK